MAMDSLKKRFDGLVTSLTKKDGSADKDSKIKSTTQIVYVFAPPGTGKVCCYVLFIYSISAIYLSYIFFLTQVDSCPAWPL